MAEPDITYRPGGDPGTAIAVSIFSDRQSLRDEMRDDVIEAGLVLRQCGPLATLLEGDVQALGEVVLVDCPVAGGAELSALARLDQRAARSGAHLVVSTSLETLEDVFACCDRSAPEILVDPSRAERVMALGRMMVRSPSKKVRELSGDDRLNLLRLTEQVGEIALRLEQMGTHGLASDGGVFRFESPTLAYSAADGAEAKGKLARVPRPPLPDPRLVRRIIRHRQLRAKFLAGELFADPAWDILLDLTAARAEHVRVSVTSLCIASGVPATTALRWISQLTAAGLLERVEDENDRRRAFIALSDTAAEAMARYFAELGREAALSS